MESCDILSMLRRHYTTITLKESMLIQYSSFFGDVHLVLKCYDCWCIICIYIKPFITKGPDHQQWFTPSFMNVHQQPTMGQQVAL